MEHRVLTPDCAAYPRRLSERLADEAPVLWYHGRLDLLDRFCLAVASTDDIPGGATQAAYQVLFTVREYAMNYVGGWHAWMETEVFRLALDRHNDPSCKRSLALLSARGLGRESAAGILRDRFGPPGSLSDFPESREFHRQFECGEMLLMSASLPDDGEVSEEKAVQRNWVACNLADVVFVPFADAESKTMRLARMLATTQIPRFTTEFPENAPLLDLGFQALTRKTVGKYLESLGASRDDPRWIPKARDPTTPAPSPGPSAGGAKLPGGEDRQRRPGGQLGLWTK